MPTFGLHYDALKLAVKEFNSDRTNVAFDTALHQAVAGGFLTDSVARIVLGVNSHWNANVGYGDLASYCKRLSDGMDDFSRRFGFLNCYPLPVWDGELLQTRIIEPACRLLVDLLGEPEPGRPRLYVFATKLLFWLTDLPPYDARARNTILQLTGVNLEPMIRNDDEFRSKYSALIVLYNEYVKGLHELRLDRDIIEYDFITQPEHLRRRNSIVRIIDKYLWLRGRRQR
jgi:hypothetical protein